MNVHHEWPIISIVGITLLVGASGVGGYFLYQEFNPTTETSNQNLSINLETPDPVNANLAANLNTNSSLENLNANTNTALPEPSVGLSDGIRWNTPEEIPSLNLFDTEERYSREQGAQYYKVGEFIEGENKGSELLLVSATYEGPAFYPAFYRFIRKGDELSFLEKHSDDLYDTDEGIRSKSTINNKTVLSSLQFPEKFTGPDGEQLVSDPYVKALFQDDKLKVAFEDAALGTIYTTAGFPSNHADIFDRYGFYLQAPDGTVKVYSMKIPFLSADQIPAITWSNGSKNTQAYQSTDLTGCGSNSYASVVSDEDVHQMNDLKVTGTTSTNEKIYEFKDGNHPTLKNQYDHEYLVFGGAEKIPYEEFIFGHPLLFWVDSFGRLIQFRSTLFIPQAECGKPVIYLYPEQTTMASVKVEPRGGMTISDPLYGSGWTVKAEPNGKLTEHSSGKTYPYLFWEGRGAIYEQPKKGFVTPKEKVHSFLIEKLAKLGLNENETKDFLEFWEPKMQSAPYYFVTFLGNREMDQLAPLTVEPHPDTIIRVLMDFTPLQQPIDVEEYRIGTPKRKGFTVVEWGGVLR